MEAKVVKHGVELMAQDKDAESAVAVKGDHVWQVGAVHDCWTQCSCAEAGD